MRKDAKKCQNIQKNLKKPNKKHEKVIENKTMGFKGGKHFGIPGVVFRVGTCA